MIWRIHKASSQCSSYSDFISTYCPEKHQSVARVCRLRWSHLNTRQFWEIHFRPTSGKIICSKELNLLKRRISGSAGEIGLSKMEKLTLSRNWSGVHFWRIRKIAEMYGEINLLIKKVSWDPHAFLDLPFSANRFPGVFLESLLSANWFPPTILAI